jgi:hypothetical protein
MVIFYTSSGIFFSILAQLSPVWRLNSMREFDMLFPITSTLSVSLLSIHEQILLYVFFSLFNFSRGINYHSLVHAIIAGSSTLWPLLIINPRCRDKNLTVVGWLLVIAAVGKVVVVVVSLLDEEAKGMSFSLNSCKKSHLEAK